MAWNATQKAYKKKDICRIYIYIYIWKCIEHVWSTQSHPWHIISLGFYFQRATGNQPFGLNKQVIVCQFHLCARAYVHITFASLSRPKCLLLQTARVWSITDPRWIHNAETEHGRAHTRGRARIPADISHDWPQISLFYKLGAFMFLGGRGGGEYQSIDYFSFPRQNEKHAIYINWTTRNPA